MMARSMGNGNRRLSENQSSHQDNCAALTRGCGRPERFGMATVRIYRNADLLGTTSQGVQAVLQRNHEVEVKSA